MSKMHHYFSWTTAYPAPGNAEKTKSWKTQYQNSHYHSKCVLLESIFRSNVLLISKPSSQTPPVQACVTFSPSFYEVTVKTRCTHTNKLSTTAVFWFSAELYQLYQTKILSLTHWLCPYEGLQYGSLSTMSQTSVFGLLSSASSSSNLFAQLTVCWFGDQLQVKWGWCCWVGRNLREFQTHSHFRILIWLWFYEKAWILSQGLLRVLLWIALILGIPLKTSLLRFCISIQGWDQIMWHVVEAC